jgi:predicted GTPase
LVFIYFTPVTADLVILAIDARKITTAEKHITNSIGSADYRFFPMMNKDGTDVETCVGSANSSFSLKPVGTAIARTNIAGS